MWTLHQLTSPTLLRTFLFPTVGNYNTAGALTCEARHNIATWYIVLKSKAWYGGTAQRKT